MELNDTRIDVLIFHHLCFLRAYQFNFAVISYLEYVTFIFYLVFSFLAPVEVKVCVANRKNWANKIYLFFSRLAVGISLLLFFLVFTFNRLH